MKNNTNTVFVTCSFKGRDKSLIKSILDIDEYYGEFLFKYTEQPHKESVFLTKKDGWQEEYYAIIKNSREPIPIQPALNPKTIRELFKYISEIFSDQKVYKKKSSEFNKYNKNKSGVPQFKNTNLLNKLSPIVSGLYELLNDGTIKTVQLKGNIIPLYQQQDCHCLLDLKNDVIYSNISVDESFCKRLVESDSSSLNIEPNGNIEIAVSLKHSCSLKIFLWYLGVMSHQRLIDQRYILSDDIIKHVQWPDYGSLPYQSEFLKLNVIISNHQLSYSQLVLQSKVTQSIINRFLNANLLLGYLVFVDHKGTVATHVQSKKSDFLKSIKSYFTKSFSVFWSKK